MKWNTYKSSWILADAFIFSLTFLFLTPALSNHVFLCFNKDFSGWIIGEEGEDL